MQNEPAPLAAAHLAFKLGACVLLMAGALLVTSNVAFSQSGTADEPRAAEEAQVSDAERPNVVIIMADDMGYSDIGAYGSEIDTPHLDQLARSGLRFRHFYNAARCVPTRASLLTGRYPHQAGLGRMVSPAGSDPDPGPYQGYLGSEPATIAEVLRQAGYGTYMSGKWHVGEDPAHWPTRRGFDRYFGLISGASSYYRIIEDQPRVRQMALDGEPWTPPDSGFYMTDATSDYAVRWIEQHRARRAEGDRAAGDRAAGDPFFLYVAYTAPHWPLHALPEDIAKYEGVYDIGWDSLRARRFQRMQEEGAVAPEARLSERPTAIPTWDEAEDKDEWARRMAVYAAMIDRMDQGIGRILDALGAAGAAENTLVLFLSDNGGSHESVAGRNLNDPSVPIGQPGSYVAYRRPWANASNTPFRRFKSWAYEGGIATPLVAYWPARIAAGGRTDQVGHVMDLMPTILDAAGAPRSDQLTGQSLLPTLEGRREAQERTLYWEHIGNRAMRQGRWKLVRDREREAWELYDLAADPTELRDVATQHPERVRQMDARWQDWAARVGVFPKP